MTFQFLINEGYLLNSLHIISKGKTTNHCGRLFTVYAQGRKWSIQLNSNRSPRQVLWTLAMACVHYRHTFGSSRYNFAFSKNKNYSNIAFCSNCCRGSLSMWFQSTQIKWWQMKSHWSYVHLFRLPELMNWLVIAITANQRQSFSKRMPPHTIRWTYRRQTQNIHILCKQEKEKQSSRNLDDRNIVCV